MRLVISILVMSSAPAMGELHDVMKGAEVDRMFGHASGAVEILAKPNLAVEFRTVRGQLSDWRKHADADEFWVIRRGRAKVSLRDAAGSEDAAPRSYDIGAGDVVNAGRRTAYRITPAGEGFQYVAVRVFPQERRLGIGIGASKTPRPMPDVVRKSQIDATFAEADKNVLLHSDGAVLINHVVYKGAHGPWEVHQTCDDLYFMWTGTAQAQIDGTLIGGKEDPPGEVRGSGVAGSRKYSVGPGDIVVIPRNTAHFMDPGPNKLGYLLVKLCE